MDALEAVTHALTPEDAARLRTAVAGLPVEEGDAEPDALASLTAAHRLLMGAVAA